MKPTWKDAVCLVVLLMITPTLLWLSGCAFGGAKETVTIVMIEPGAVVEVATDDKIPVITNPGVDPKDQVVAKKNIGGMVVVPKSVYREMRACWMQSHPEKP